MDLNIQHEKIYRYFKTTTEYYDYLDWDGDTLKVFYKDEVIEEYSKEDLTELEIL